MMAKTILGIALLIVLASVAASQPPRDNATTRTTQADGKYRISVGDQLCVGFIADSSRTPRTIVPGDRLALSYHFGVAEPGKPYHVEPGDKLSLYFKYSPVLQRTYLTPNGDSYQSVSGETTVQPDGTLVLRAIDQPLMVANRTTTEITALVQDVYKKAGILEHPAVNISVEPQYERERTLKNMFQSAPGESSPFIRVTVAPDGGLGLPLISGVATAGKTAAMLADELTARYHKLGYRHVTISAWLSSETDPRLEALRTLAGGSGPMKLRVLTGGEISLPLLHTYAAAGKGPAQLARELTERYRTEGYGGVRVTVWVEEAATR